MIRVFTLALLCSFSSFAQADFSGVWSGTGTFNDNRGTAKACETMSFTVEQSAAELKINSKIICGGETMDPMAGKMKIAGSDLISSTGAKIGTITANAFAFNVVTPDFSIDAKAALAGGALNFLIQKTEKESPGMVFSFAGVLKK